MPNFFTLLKSISAALLLGSLWPLSSYAETSDTRLSFSLSFQGIHSDLSVLTTTLMPEATLKVQTKATAMAEDGELSPTAKGWAWTAPKTPGKYEVEFTQNGETMLLNIFVLTPFQNGKQTSLNGYKIGSYTKKLFRGLSSYAAPKGFIDLSHGPGDLKISPHFTLSQFICKQQPGHKPTYLLIRPETLLKLETLLEAAQEKGWHAETLHVMSGFRTPFYNRSIGNHTTSSRHLYGGAADIWIDGDHDGKMDDLNRDGKINKDDAREFAILAEQLASKHDKNWPAGGIGVYDANASHGPFIHIDSRGYKARWGQ